MPSPRSAEPCSSTAASTSCSERCTSSAENSRAASSAATGGRRGPDAVADRPEIVIDTAPLLAFLAGALGGLGSGARRALRRASAGRVRLVVPTICLFEVGQLAERGRIALGLSFDEWCERLVAVPALRVVPLEIPHVSEARALPSLRDPFDRLIAGTAVALGAPLLTSDARIANSERVRVIW